MIREGVTFPESPKEAIQTRIADFDITVDYGELFGDQHEPRRAKATTQALLEMLKRGETINAEYSNPLGHRAVESYEVPATWAIAYALENLPGNFNVVGSINETMGLKKTPIERSASVTITPIRKDGKRLVSKLMQDGKTYQRSVYWMTDAAAQELIEEEKENIRSNSR